MHPAGGAGADTESTEARLASAATTLANAPPRRDWATFRLHSRHLIQEYSDLIQGLRYLQAGGGEPGPRPPSTTEDRSDPSTLPVSTSTVALRVPIAPGLLALARWDRASHPYIILYLGAGVWVALLADQAITAAEERCKLLQGLMGQPQTGRSAAPWSPPS